ncbi:MAG: precorrin-3B C(17)-methyltransferase [Desulfobacterales bacterium]|nr:precorrin-3B C(17)-methyltransferase [Desulfobacterales bacterium]
MLYIIGIGPGNTEHLSLKAHDTLKSVHTVVGYTQYIEHIAHLIQGKEIISTPMQKEVNRVQTAIEIARSGKSCALVSSGDSGIYAMAGLVFEFCQANHIPIIGKRSELSPTNQQSPLKVEVIPGIPALCAGASLLGAPLTHDFASISLSTLLTPWEVIEKRIHAAASADFVIVFYNPKSQKRDWQLDQAREILLQYRNESTPVGIVRHAMREHESVQLVTLTTLHTAEIDMNSVVFIGNSTTTVYQGYMITPRGYSTKYTFGV